MKTPHRITLLRGEATSNYDPVTDSYSTGEIQEQEVPCLINFISQARIVELYGIRNGKIMICRFQQEQQPFDYAIYKNERYTPLDEVGTPIKGAIRLKRVGE